MAKGVRGPELRDYTMICLAEARLTCLRQAVAQKMRGPERRDFMGRCISGPQGQNEAYPASFFPR